MECPHCDAPLSLDWLRKDGIEADYEFGCPNCDTQLRLVVDGAPYHEDPQASLMIVDD